MASTAVASHGVTILVDEAVWPHRGRRWCHYVSDTSLDELQAFARRLDLPRRGFQGDHYDICLTKRSIAVSAGALEVTYRQLGCMVANRKETGVLGDPVDAIDLRRELRRSRQAGTRL